MVTQNAGPKVNDFRLAFIWHSSTFPRAGGFGDPLVGPDTFQKAFAAAGKSESFRRPWPPHRRQRFWMSFLEALDGSAPPGISGSVAWRKLVPLAMPGASKLEPTLADARAWSEALVHPWGVTMILSLASTNRWPSLAALGEQLAEIDREGIFPNGSGKANTFREQAGLELRSVAEKLGVESPGLPEGPFSIFTVAQAEGAGSDCSPEREEVRRLLHVATSFSRHWRKDSLPELASVRVAGRATDPENHVVYGHGRARAIWAPASFLDSGIRTLGCYHRNLVMASAQTESLCSFICETARQLRTGPSLRVEHRTLAKRAAGVLARLYLGKSTYRSGSVQDQIALGSSRECLDDVRDEMGQKKLPGGSVAAT